MTNRSRILALVEAQRLLALRRGGFFLNNDALHLLLERWHTGFQAAVAEEIAHRRLFSLLAISFGLGVLTFFQAEGAPARYPPLIAIAVLAPLLFFARHTFWRRGIVWVLILFFAGFAAAAWRTHTVAAPVLPKVTIGLLTGFVESLDERGVDGVRFLVRVQRFATLSPEQTPYKVRVTTKHRHSVQVGDFIQTQARLLPPPQPAHPQGYDFAREAYFAQIGAVGSLLGAPKITAPPTEISWDLRVQIWIESGRTALTERIQTVIGGQAGAIGAALITGKRGGIYEETNAALRGAGIYHVISISGLHMVLAAGAFFWTLRAVLAFIPACVLYWPVRKMAAVVAMVGASAYCIFSGSEVAAERSLIMTLVMLGAIVCDRPALSMRNLALSVILVLAREPETLLGPSFQMSFGAVAMLIAGAEAWRRWRPAAPVPSTVWLQNALDWARRHLMTALGTTLLATLATLPFGLYHFQTSNPYGLIGNAITLPLISGIVMPMGVAGVVTAPFGLDRPFWEIMGWACALVLQLSQTVSSFQGSTLVSPAFGTPALLWLTFALLVFTLPFTNLRLFAVFPLGVGAWLAATPLPNDIFVDRSGTGALIRGANGRMVKVGTVSSFVLEQWLRASGDARMAGDLTLTEGARCDAVGCVVLTPHGKSIAFLKKNDTWEEDCNRADVVIAAKPLPHCAQGLSAPLVIDTTALGAFGAHTLRWRSQGWHIITSNRLNETRPWRVSYQN
jgi:competence protein ComEC